MANKQPDPPPPVPTTDLQALRRQIQQLILMKETGPKSAAWHRARLQTIWRLQRRFTALQERNREPD